MASRLLARSKTLALTLTRTPFHHLSSAPIDPIASSQSLRCLHSLTSIARFQQFDSSPAISSILSSPKNFGYEKTLPRWYCVKAQGGPISQVYHSADKQEIVMPAEKEVLCFSPLEANSTRTRCSGLRNESLKIKRIELSQKITYAVIPALILISKSSLTTSLLIFSVYWQIYGFFKEIFLDYVHQEITREWVLIYFKVLLLILAKDTILDFGLV